MAATSWRFDFGTGEPQTGYTKITAQSRYGAEVGFGFTRTERIAAKDRREPGPLRPDFCIPLDTSFAVNFPDGAKDNTHFRQQGGIEIARLVYEELKRLQRQPLSLYLR
ncbi:hypothetical protein [Cohnella zeiphila]|uniref:Beta-agarase/YXIM esterase-like galactose-binding domain-containing protein n=1 Tax=Cohnella zeiphila TaxID=2761120 RepID=A0A7X0VYL7_9BACL|nr:hypothetical protein [Cohnella zeiphila]MBB6734860.1 hypothetical protein [Cohnella zeiphila]